MLCEVLVGVDAGEPRVSVTDSCRVAWLPVDPDVVMILAVGQDRPTVRAAVGGLRP